MIFVVSYDVPNDRRRLRIMKIVQDFGRRVQYSVFECDLSTPQLMRLQERLAEVVDPALDDVRFYPLCESCIGKAQRMGRRRDPVVKRIYIIG